VALAVRLARLADEQSRGPRGNGGGLVGLLRRLRAGLFILSLAPFRKVIRDYFLVCDSYFSAIRSSTPAQIEAIDMGRRGLHNEGSTLLSERLAGKVTIDFDTARRLFTLICALHVRG
jgi:uncharacterized protein (UPF0262 family)